MLRLTACVLLALLTISYAAAGSRQAGQFDYYVLSLSWSPSWCAIEGDAKRSRQCRPANDLGFVLHGLWPQYEKGWPSFCASDNRAPSKRLMAAMADIFGTAGRAWHQWDKHGRCSDLPAAEYFDLSRQAYAQIDRPQVFRRLLKPLQIPALVVESAFLEVNPDLRADMITVTCKRSHFQEVRICLNKDLSPRKCSPDVIRDCTRKVLFPPVR